MHYNKLHKLKWAGKKKDNVLVTDCVKPNQ